MVSLCPRIESIVPYSASFCIDIFIAMIAVLHLSRYLYVAMNLEETLNVYKILPDKGLELVKV